MASKRLLTHLGAGAKFAPRSRSLGYAELLQVETAMSEIAPDWLTELVDNDTDDATLVLVPDDGTDSSGPSFVISQDEYGFCLHQVHWDVMTEVGTFASLTDLLLAMRQRLAFSACGTVPGPITVH